MNKEISQEKSEEETALENVKKESCMHPQNYMKTNT